MGYVLGPGGDRLNPLYPQPRTDAIVHLASGFMALGFGAFQGLGFSEGSSPVGIYIGALCLVGGGLMLFEGLCKPVLKRGS